MKEEIDSLLYRMQAKIADDSAKSWIDGYRYYERHVAPGLIEKAWNQGHSIGRDDVDAYDDDVEYADG